MLTHFPDPITACVFGASGGIGAALVRALAADPAIAHVHAGARIPPNASEGVHPFAFDLHDENSIAAAAQGMANDAPALVIVATGMLHGDGVQPEKSWARQEANAYAQLFAVNATGPALIGKYMLPLLPRRGRAVFAALSARVGSIEDNRLGGWHAYRASKAALNMIVRTFAIELAARNPEALAVTLHPGTVATSLSDPFSGRVPPEKLFTADRSAGHLLDVIDGLTPADTGRLFAWDGTALPF